ncbi:hypothetical protein Hsero_4236 [Herbaspirillum seropedicae SmR1]|uniref:Uncharacterized protein n=1 Tax=Herbaspirillum seropedicae (strain SmR1) TaxID=757424 RepID=D8IUH3_HERSS|nr:hypothetical protein Hsero_4236 [Herbaspirillum seropedicae SmR1]
MIVEPPARWRSLAADIRILDVCSESDDISLQMHSSASNFYQMRLLLRVKTKNRIAGLKINLYDDRITLR